MAAAPRPIKKGRGRKSYGTTGEESILAFCETIWALRRPRRSSTTGRAKAAKGSSDNVLSLMVKAGKLKRTAMKDQRGSRYSVA